jgi:VIT1/CCC1 family predicted Fe2+/Mn2+ transporter
MWREYSEMSNLGEIARRKFFNNCFDGALTCAGIVSGMFILFISDPTKNVPIDVVITGFATALAIGISGLWGAFLSEEAERKKKISDLKRDMAIYESPEDIIKLDDEGDLIIDSSDQEEKEIRLAMVTPIIFNSRKSHRRIKLRHKYNNKRKESLVERAESFASIIAAIVDGAAPALGSSLPLIPFFFGMNLTFFHFIFSYAILIGILVYLGIFLGSISGGGKLRYVINLVLAGIITLLISILLGQLSP